jgi:hypothetical protein
VNAFLTPLEVHQLTGASRAKKQVEWLRQHSIPFIQDGNRVIVYHAHVKLVAEGRPPTFSSGPNWSAIR